MPVNADMLEKQVRNTIIKNDLLGKGDHVIVGLSGGPDSVCLFYVLLELKDEYELSVSTVHVNHMLRAGEAVKDQEYAEGICRYAGVVCMSVVRDCAAIAKERGVTDEEAGRDIRYEAFYEAAKELIDGGTPSERVKIAVAQNKNDQAETVLMRMIRGAGVNGLSGIDYKRAGEYDTSVIRPLLDVGRSEIENYCAERNICPRIDRTNEQPVYTRNKVRLELIPYIAERFNENIIDALVRLSRNAKEDNDYLKGFAEAEYERVKKKAAGRPVGVNAERLAVMDRRGLAELAPAIRHRAVIAAFREIGLARDISAAHLSMTDNIILGKNASAEVNLPGGYAMAVSYDNAAACLNIAEYVGRGMGFAGGVTGMGAEKTGLTVKLFTIEEYRNMADGTQMYAGGYEASTPDGEAQTQMKRENSGAEQPQPQRGARQGQSCDGQRDTPVAGWYEASLAEGETQTQTTQGAEQTRVSHVLTAAFDYGRLKESAADAPGSLELRSRRPGDYFTPRGMKTGRKKIQDYFVDRKIPKGSRDSYKLAAIGSEIIWIAGPALSGHNEVSEKYRLIGDTKEVMVLEINYET